MYGVVVFAVYKVVANVAVLVEIELHKREAPEVGHYEVLAQLFEPWRAQLRVDGVVRAVVAAELYRYLRDAAQAFVEYSGEMQVEHGALIHVVEPHAVRIVYAESRLHRAYVCVHVE